MHVHVLRCAYAFGPADFSLIMLAQSDMGTTAGGINARHHHVEMGRDMIGAVAGDGPQGHRIWQHECSAPGHNKTAVTQFLDRTRDECSSNTEHCRQLFMCQHNFIGAGAMRRIQQPAGRSLPNGMSGVAGRILEELRNEIVRVTGEPVAQADGLGFHILEMSGPDGEKHAAIADTRAGIGRNPSVRDDTANRALPPDCCHIDRVSSIIRRDLKARTRGIAGKPRLHNFISRFLHDIAGLHFHAKQMTGYKGPVLLAEAGQKHVGWTLM